MHMRLLSVTDYPPRSHRLLANNSKLCYNTGRSWPGNLELGDSRGGLDPPDANGSTGGGDPFKCMASGDSAWKTELSRVPTDEQN